MPPGELLFKRVTKTGDGTYRIAVGYRPVRAHTLWKGSHGGFTFMPKTAFKRDGTVRSPRKNSPHPFPLHALLEGHLQARALRKRPLHALESHLQERASRKRA